MFRHRAAAILLLSAAAAFLWRFPVWQIWLAAGAAAYVLLLLKFPGAWLIAVPAAMPVLDLAAFSGWYFFDAFDALVLLTVAILLLREPPRREDFTVGWPVAAVLSVLIVSYAVSLGIALTPWPAIDGNSFASYYSPVNAVRIAKGFVWALLLLPWLNRSIRDSSRTGRYLACGLLLGLFGVALAGLYEHWLFAGLFNFGGTYRITGPFSSMHTGDGHIDLWLAVTIPLLAAPFVQRAAAGWRLAALCLAAPSFYVLLATASRGPFLATAAALFAMLFMLVLVWARRGRPRRILLACPMIAVLLALGSAPFIVPTELGSRFERTAGDFETRAAHWREVLSLRDRQTLTPLFGMGLGAFPAAYARHHRPARYAFDGPSVFRDSGNGYLTLKSGDNLYMGQIVDARPDTAYRLSFVYRTANPSARLTVSICEKWLLHSLGCSWNSYRLPPTGGAWVSHTAAIATDDLGRPRGGAGIPSKRPLWLTLHTAGARRGLSIDNIAFVGPGGINLIKNGDFSGLNDRWFWTVDNHLPWHTKNMALGVLFDQGWVGLAAVTLLFCLALASLGRAIRAGYAVAVPWLGAMVGYLVMAAVVSPFDQPRLAMLFYLLCLFCTLQFFRGWAPLRDQIP